MQVEWYPTGPSGWVPLKDLQMSLEEMMDIHRRTDGLYIVSLRLGGVMFRKRVPSLTAAKRAAEKVLAALENDPIADAGFDVFDETEGSITP